MSVAPVLERKRGWWRRGGGRFNGSHAGAIPFLRGRRAAHETVRFTEVRVVLVRVKPTISSVC